jgi:hypothetical protein
MNWLKPLIHLRKVGYVIHTRIGPIEDFQGWQKVDDPSHGYNFFTWTYFITHRDGYYQKYFKDDRLAFFAENIKPNARVLIIVDKEALVFPYLIRRPDLGITATNANKVYLKGKYIHFANLNGLLYLE